MSTRQQLGLVTAQVATISVTFLATLVLLRFVRPCDMMFTCNDSFASLPIILLVSCMQALTTRGALRSRLSAMAPKSFAFRRSIQQDENSGKMQMILPF
jgi:hypothetical protein